MRERPATVGGLELALEARDADLEGRSRWKLGGGGPDGGLPARRGEGGGHSNGGQPWEIVALGRPITLMAGGSLLSRNARMGSIASAVAGT